MARDLSVIWTYFADSSCGTYSPLYDRIARAVAADDDILDLIAEAPAHAHLPTDLMACVHYMVLGGGDHPLIDVYAGRSDADPGPLFIDFCLGRRRELLALLATHHTNTNEVGRSAVLAPAITTVARRHGEPVGLVDVGCSAGLNMFCDRYLLDYGPAGTTGDADAAVRISCTITGGSPPVAPRLPAIAARVGIDLDPVDLSVDDNVRWQLACVWPDTGRLSRTRLALDEVRKSPPRIVLGDAADAVAEVVAGLPPEVVPVVTTTWAMAYLLPERRQAFRRALADAAPGRTVAWISAEGSGVIDIPGGAEAPSDERGIHASVLGLVTMQGGTGVAELLGYCHPHGGWLDWRA